MTDAKHMIVNKLVGHASTLQYLCEDDATKETNNVACLDHLLKAFGFVHKCSAHSSTNHAAYYQQRSTQTRKGLEEKNTAESYKLSAVQWQQTAGRIPVIQSEIII